MKLEYNLINTITSSNKQDAAIINNELEFVDLEGKKVPLNNSLKIRGSVNYSWIKQILKDNDYYSDTDETHSEAIFNQWNKNYNLNDYSLGFFCSVSDYPTSFILPITKFEIERISEDTVYNLYFDLGDGYTAETSVNFIKDDETGGTSIIVGEFVIYQPEHVQYYGFEHDYGLDELDNYDLADYAEEYAEYTKQHFKEMFIQDQIAPRVLKDIESNVSNWLVPYYANNNIQSEDLTECNYSKDRPFLPLFIFDDSDEFNNIYRLIKPEHPDYTYKEN